MDVALQLSELVANLLASEDDRQASRRAGPNGGSDVAKRSLEHLLIGAT
jgi:hypothetical protein